MLDFYNYLEKFICYFKKLFVSQKFRNVPQGSS
jgi:hypothetical protein